MLVENEIIAIPTAIVCDDIRREDNGKEFLVGVYSADIIPMAMPVVFGLSFWVPIEVKRQGNTNVNFRIKGVDGGVLHQLPPLPVKIGRAHV